MFVVEYAGDLIDIGDAKVTYHIGDYLDILVLLRTARLGTPWTMSRAASCTTSDTRTSSFGGQTSILRSLYTI